MLLGSQAALLVSYLLLWIVLDLWAIRGQPIDGSFWAYIQGFVGIFTLYSFPIVSAVFAYRVISKDTEDIPLKVLLTVLYSLAATGIGIILIFVVFRKLHYWYGGAPF